MTTDNEQIRKLPIFVFPHHPSPANKCKLLPTIANLFKSFFLSTGRLSVIRINLKDIDDYHLIIMPLKLFNSTISKYLAYENSEKIK